MITIVWQFEVAPGAEAEFEKHYGPEGTWVQLFRRDAAFRRTLLFRDRERPNRYVTVDRWDNLSSYDTFRTQFAEEYRQIDAQMEALTVSEVKLGVFDQV